MEMDMKRLNLKKLNEREVKEQYQVTITNKSAALENTGNINRARDTIKENINILGRQSQLL
jgi:hypothetical protein